MQLFDLFEKNLRVEVNSKWHNVQTVNVEENPTLIQLLRIIKSSEYHKLRGLIVGSNVFWWDAAKSYHAHIAEVFDPKFPDYDLTKRLMLSVEPSGEIFIDCELEILKHPQILRILKSDKILFHYPGHGMVVYSEVKNELI